MAKKGNGADAPGEDEAKKTGPETAGDTAAEAAADAGQAALGGHPQGMDEEMLQKIAAVRARLRESFGAVVMAMMMMPRYRHQSLADLQNMVLEPLIRDRIAIAHPGGKQDTAAPTPAAQDIAGMAIWASVSEEADARIREQIRAGVFPVRLKPGDWTSGEINWLLDVIAPDRKIIASVIASFRQVVKGGELRLHPVVAGMLDAETLEKLGMKKAKPGEPAQKTPASPDTTPDEA